MVSLGMNTVGFEQGAKRAQSTFDGLSRSIRKGISAEMAVLGRAVAGVFTVQAVSRFSAHLKDTVGEIKDMAELLGISTDEVQRLQKATANTGNQMRTLVSSIERIESLRASAATGDKKAIGTFGILGIDPSKGNPLDILRQVVDASSKGSLQAAAAYNIVGNKALKIKQVMGELQQLGPMKLIEKEQIDQIDAVFKRLDEAKRRFTVSSAPVATAVIEGAANITDPSYWNLLSSMAAKAFANATGQFYTASLIDETAGDVSLSALPLPSKASASDVNAAAMATAEAEEKAKEKRSSSFNRAGPSSLNQGGGFFFDRPARQDDPNSRRLERVAVATEKTARVMEETVR
jgi:hypothetical protein